MRAILVLTVALAAAPSAWARGSTDVPKEEWRMTCLDNCLLQTMTWLRTCTSDSCRTSSSAYHELCSALCEKTAEEMYRAVPEKPSDYAPRP
jgi:hypothetical protein